MPSDGQLTHFHGTIKDVDTGAGIPNAVFDMWQASTNGKYDAHDPENQTKNNLRGKFRTDADGKAYVVLTTALRRGEYNAIRIVRRGHRANGKLYVRDVLTAPIS